MRRNDINSLKYKLLKPFDSDINAEDENFDPNISLTDSAFDNNTDGLLKSSCYMMTGNPLPSSSRSNNMEVSCGIFPVCNKKIAFAVIEKGYQ